MYIGYSNTKNLCSKNIYFTEVDGAVTEKTPILDPDLLLGASGSIILWFCISGIMRVVLIILQLSCSIKKNISALSILMSFYLLFAFGMSVYGLHLIFGEEMHQQCIDYEMGNNLGYVFCILYALLI